MLCKNRKSLMSLLLALCLLLCACGQNPPAEKLYAKLLGRIADAGYSTTPEPVPEGMPVGFANASHWQRLQLGSETVLVYFDESNRADYLKSFVDPELFSTVTRFGQRFVLAYNGTDETIIRLLKELDQSMP